MIADGKYDQISIAALRETHAKAVLVAVIDGKHGNGFSVSVREDAEEIRRAMPDVLRLMADFIEAANRSGS